MPLCASLAAPASKRSIRPFWKTMDRLASFHDMGSRATSRCPRAGTTSLATYWNGNFGFGMDFTGLHSLFAYNEWANARLFSATADLSNEQLTRDLGSSFRSICDTL